MDPKGMLIARHVNPIAKSWPLVQGDDFVRRMDGALIISDREETCSLVSIYQVKLCNVVFARPDARTEQVEREFIRIDLHGES